MANFAYIRVSDHHNQDGRNQKHTIKEYANQHGIIISAGNIIEQHVSASKTTLADRGWNQIVNKLNPGDNLLISDISRLGRTKPMATIGLVQQILDKGAKLILCYSNTVIESSVEDDPSTLFMLLGEAWSAVRLAKDRAVKAKTACHLRKQQGLLNGRPPGAIVRSKLDAFEFEIVTLLNDGLNKSYISKRFGVSRTTLSNWLNTRDILKQKATELGMSARSLTEIKAILKKEAKHESHSPNQSHCNRSNR